MLRRDNEGYGVQKETVTPWAGGSAMRVADQIIPGEPDAILANLALNMTVRQVH